MTNPLSQVKYTFGQRLVKGRLIRRYKRFLADVELENGQVAVALCPNTGSMLGCMEKGAPVYLSRADNPKRKTAFTWEMVKMNGGWVGINTGVPNKLAAMAARARALPMFSDATFVKPEVKVGQHTRLDLYVERVRGPLYVEVKNVTLVRNGLAEFPDAATSRGAKHLNELVRLKGEGACAAMLYLVQRGDGKSFAPARDIDPAYADAFAKARAAGVEMVVVQARVTPRSISLQRFLPLAG